MLYQLGMSEVKPVVNVSSEASSGKYFSSFFENDGFEKTGV